MLDQRQTQWVNTAPAPAERLLGYCLEAGAALKQYRDNAYMWDWRGGGSAVPERGALQHKGAWS